MKAAFLALGVALIAAAVWFSGLLAPPASQLLITQVTASPMGNGAAAVLTIENQGVPDQLIAVSSPTKQVMLHKAGNGLPIPTGTSSLAMDAAHIMIASDTPIPDGTLIPLTLTFVKAKDISVKARYSKPNSGSVADHMAMGHGAMTQDVGSEPGPILTLLAEPNGTGWVAHIDVKNFTFSQDLQDGDHVPGIGHGHIYLGGMKLGRVFSDRFDIGALPPGQHVLRVTLNTNNHRAYVVDGQPVAAEVIITVD